MKINRLSTILFLGVLLSCENKESDSAPVNNADGTSNDTLVSDSVSTQTSPVWEVTATAQTEAVSANPEDDAADDPAIWYNESDPSRSLIFGSDKTNGLDVFDLKGKRIKTDLVGRINNVDVRDNFMGQFPILGGSNRDSIGMDFWKIDPSSLEVTHIGMIRSQLPDVYGFCLYQNIEEATTYALVNSKTGRVEQWKLSFANGKVKGEMVRELKLPSQVEGMIADDEMNLLYVGVEAGGIYRFDANDDARTNGTLIPMSNEENKNIRYDVEGLTIYKAGKRGYLIASSQGNNTYAVFTRTVPNDYIGSFRIVDGTFDGVEETDGIDVSHHSFGSDYPSGVFVCQDGFNYEGETKVAQNFKMVHWSDIASAFKPKLLLKE